MAGFLERLGLPAQGRTEHRVPSSPAQGVRRARPCENLESQLRRRTTIDPFESAERIVRLSRVATATTERSVLGPGTSPASGSARQGGGHARIAILLVRRAATWRSPWQVFRTRPVPTECGRSTSAEGRSCTSPCLWIGSPTGEAVRSTAAAVGRGRWLAVRTSPGSPAWPATRVDEARSLDAAEAPRTAPTRPSRGSVVHRRRSAGADGPRGRQPPCAAHGPRGDAAPAGRTTSRDARRGSDCGSRSRAASATRVDRVETHVRRSTGCRTRPPTLVD